MAARPIYDSGDGHMLWADIAWPVCNLVLVIFAIAIGATADCDGNEIWPIWTSCCADTLDLMVLILGGDMTAADYELPAGFSDEIAVVMPDGIAPDKHWIGGGL